MEFQTSSHALWLRSKRLGKFKKSPKQSFIELFLTQFSSPSFKGSDHWDKKINYGEWAPVLGWRHLIRVTPADFLYHLYLLLLEEKKKHIFLVRHSKWSLQNPGLSFLWLTMAERLIIQWQSISSTRFVRSGICFRTILHNTTIALNSQFD